MMKRMLCLFSALLAVSACVGPPDRAPGKNKQKLSRPATKDARQCLSDLDKMKARYSFLPEQDFGNGCSQTGSVQLYDVGIPVTNVKAVKCDVARALGDWTRDTLQPAARKAFGARVVKIESMGGYSCRNVIGRPQAAGNRSEHATGNAIDIGGFLLSNGRRVSIVAGWNGMDDERNFLRTVRAGACKRFQTVLSPDYNAAHYNHLHFDLGRGPYCR
jgi:hypothetical protein